MHELHVSLVRASGGGALSQPNRCDGRSGVGSCWVVWEHLQAYVGDGCVQMVRVADGVPRLRGVFERADADETSSGDHDDLQDVTDLTVGNSSVGSAPSRPMGRQTVNVTSRWVDLYYSVWL